LHPGIESLLECIAHVDRVIDITCTQRAVPELGNDEINERRFLAVADLG
jgi:hypothetical protein